MNTIENILMNLILLLQSRNNDNRYLYIAVICDGKKRIPPHKGGTKMKKKNEATHVSSKSFSSIADPIRRSNFAFSSLKTERVVGNISVCCTNLLRRTSLFIDVDYLHYRLQKQTCHLNWNAHMHKVYSNKSQCQASGRFTPT